MKTIEVDLQHERIEVDLVSLEGRRSKQDLVVKNIQPDECVWLRDGELWVEGIVRWDGRVYTAHIYWDTKRATEPEEEEP